MRVWILYKFSQDELQPHHYEMHSFLEKGQQLGIDIRIIKPEQFDLFVTRGGRKSIMVDGEITQLPDIVIPRMGAGTTYFALAILRQLEHLGVPVINSSESIELVKDKLFSQQVLAKSKLPVPKTMLVKFPIDVDLIESELGFPVIVKTLSGSKGAGVFLADNKKTFEDLMQLIQTTSGTVNIILQEFISFSRGKDLRVIVIGGRAVSCMQRTATDDNFKANIAQGGKGSQYPLTPEIEWMAREATRVLNLDVAGVDLLFDHDHFKVCEVNSSPQFQGMESCHKNLSIATEILRYAQIRLGNFEALRDLPALPSPQVTPVALPELESVL